MNKEDIAYRVEQYLNGEIESADIYLEKPENAKEQFFYNTIKRLIRAYKFCLLYTSPSPRDCS